MMKSRQTVAQQSHRTGIAFGARPHRAKRSLSLLAKVKQTPRRFRLIFEVGAADPFLQIEIKNERHSTRSRAVANGDGSWGGCVDTCGVAFKLSNRFFGALAGARFFFGFRPRLLGIGKQ